MQSASWLSNGCGLLRPEIANGEDGLYEFALFEHLAALNDEMDANGPCLGAPVETDFGQC